MKSRFQIVLSNRSGADPGSRPLGVWQRFKLLFAVLGIFTVAVAVLLLALILGSILAAVLWVALVLAIAAVIVKVAWRGLRRAQS